MTDTLSAGPDAVAGAPGEGGAKPAEQPAEKSARSDSGSDADPDGSAGPARANPRDPATGQSTPRADAPRPANGYGAQRSPEPDGPGRRPTTPSEAAVWYADMLGWQVTPAVGRIDETAAAAEAAPTVAAQTAESPDRAASALAPGPWLWAASASPRLVEAIWHRCPNAPILAMLGSEVPGAVTLGAVDVPALVGAAALERLGRVPAAVGPVVDGQGRIRFLVDLGPDYKGECAFERWREAGVDLWARGPGEFCPLPTPGSRGPTAVVWAVPPDPGRPALPAARLVSEVLDRAVRDAYPALWHTAVAD